MKKQLFCFTYAGGTASFYDQIGELLRPELDVAKLEYSGHGTRHKEPLYQNFQDAAKDLCEVIKSRYCGGEYALMGYSMGSIAATEVLRTILETKELPEPEHIFLAAHEPYAVICLNGPDREQQDEYIKQRTIQFGGVPEKLIHNRSFWRMYLPLYRADYSMIGAYDFNNLKLKTIIPTTVFYSEADTPLTEIKKWNNYYVGPCEFIEYSGSHFFINEHYMEMAEVITERLGVSRHDIR